MAETFRATQALYLAAVANTSPPPFRATQALYLALVKRGGQPVRVTQIVGLAAVRKTPDLSWGMTFLNIRFPRGIADGSEGGPGFSTDVVEVDSGFDQRIARWDEGMLTFNVAKGVDTAAKMHELMRFFRVVKGRANAFLYPDALDYATWDWDGQNPGTVAIDDQPLGTGDGSTYVFQLTKTYTYDDGEHAVQSVTRTIAKPIGSTVVVGVAASAAASAVQVTNWSLDETTGVLTFLSRASVIGNDISVAGTNRFQSSGSTIFSTFLVDDAIQVSQSSANDTSGDATYTVTSVNASQLFVAETLVNEGAGPSIIVNVHPAPRTGEPITWGGEFDVPARFATDELPIRLEQYNVGTATVLVEEVRVSAAI